MTTYLRLPDIFTQMSYCHSHQTSFHPSIPGSIYPSAQVRMLVTAFDSSITHSVTKSWPFHFLHASLFPCTYSVQAILCHWMCYISLTLSSCFRSIWIPEQRNGRSSTDILRASFCVREHEKRGIRISWQPWAWSFHRMPQYFSPKTVKWMPRTVTGWVRTSRSFSLPTHLFTLPHFPQGKQILSWKKII